MYFVGRAKETRQLIHAIEDGKNVLVTGKYGIGRTALTRHVASILQDKYRFIFLDGEQTPGKLCGWIVSELYPDVGNRRRDGVLNYKKGRALLRDIHLRGGLMPVLVLDNLAKVSTPKLEFIQLLSWGHKCRLVAIVEAFLPKDDLAQLSSRLIPHEEIHLGYLPPQSAAEFFRYHSTAHSLGWGEEEIKVNAQVTGGYPLNMVSLVQRELERIKKSAGSP